MFSSDSTSFASPFDDFFQRYLPKEHEKTLRNSFLQAIALVTVGGLFFGLYYVYNILEPFCVPLLWALLSGIVLHPYKKIITRAVKSAVDNVVRNDETIVAALGISLMEGVDKVADCIGTYFIKNWKIFVTASLALPILQMLTCQFPEALSVTLELLQNLLILHLTALNNVQFHHLICSLMIFIVTVVFCREEHGFLCQAASMLTWILGAAHITNYLWPPLVYLLIILWMYGYCTEPAHQDDYDGSPSLRQQNTRIKSALLAFLGKVGMLDPEEPEVPFEDAREASKPAPKTSTPILREVSPLTDRQSDSLKPSKLLSVDHGTDGLKLLHPGVSKLQKQHGILRPNVSGIGQVGGNTPKSRLLGRSYVYRMKRRSSLHTFGNDSWTYIRWALWSCLLLQLWIRPSLAHLLPAPIMYYLVKKMGSYTGTTKFLQSKMDLIRGNIQEYLQFRKHLFFPPLLLFILRVSYSVERKLLSGLSKYLDVIVTIIMILTMMVGITIAGIFISFQVYAESVYILQSVGSLTTTLNMTDSYIFNKLNTSMSGIDDVVEGAFNYGKGWISRTLQQLLTDEDGTERSDLEVKVLELWDRSYQYWVTDQRTAEKEKLVQEEFSSRVGKLFTQLYNNSNLYNLAALQTFTQNNMGTLTSILEQVWSLTKGNVGFFIETGFGMIKVILNSGSGVVNFFFNIFVYLTALFYLLSNSTDSYIPMDIISQYSIFQISGVGAAIQKAVNSVFLITIKMSCFYLLWTYITHILFGASIVFVPIIFR